MQQTDPGVKVSEVESELGGGGGGGDDEFSARIGQRDSDREKEIIPRRQERQHGALPYLHQISQWNL